MGLAQLNKSELKLKRLCNKHGILGIDRVLQYALNEWQRDIKRHQLPNILGSVGPMQSVIQLGLFLSFLSLQFPSIFSEVSMTVDIFTSCCVNFGQDLLS